MRRFLDSRSYAPSNGPDEYKKDFLSVLEQFHYNKRSLVRTTFETDKIKSIDPLPPITGAFNLHQAAELNAIVDSQYLNKGYNVVLLHDSAKALMVNSIVLGSTNYRHSNSSLVLVKTSPNTSTLCEIQFFVKCKSVSSLQSNGLESVCCN